LPDRQLQLFQPFHLWHTLPGAPVEAFLIPVQKAASCTRAFLDNAFFIPASFLSMIFRSIDTHINYNKFLPIVNPTNARQRERRERLCLLA
jgi:hypothetical protein